MKKRSQYFVYLPKDLAEDNMFPFQGQRYDIVKVCFALGDSNCWLRNGQGLNSRKNSLILKKLK